MSNPYITSAQELAAFIRSSDNTLKSRPIWGVSGLSIIKEGARWSFHFKHAGRRYHGTLGTYPHSNILTMNTMGAIKRAVQTGLGLAVMPLLSVSEEIRRGDLVELRKEVNPDHKKESSRCIYAIYKQEHLPALRELFFKECNISPLSTL